MARSEFINELTQMGYKVEDTENNKVIFQYVIPVGRLAGQQIQLGFIVTDDFPLTPPSGPHILPRLLPINTTHGAHPDHGIHPSDDFGPDWEYWSRPFPDWEKTDRSVKAYLRHIRHLFDTL